MSRLINNNESRIEESYLRTLQKNKIIFWKEPKDGYFCSTNREAVG
jgi:hypothetical protein